MNATKIFITIFAFVAIGSIVFEAWEIQRLNAELMNLTRQRDAMVLQLEARKRENESLATDRHDRFTNTTGAVSTHARIGNPMLDDLRDFMSFPAYRNLQATLLKGHLDGAYGALFKSLALSSDQLARLKDLLVAKQQAIIDATAIAREQGISANHAIQNALGPLNDEIKSVLGDSGYNQFQEYDQTLPQRTQVKQLQESLSYTQTPLSGDQASQLIQALHHVPSTPGGPVATIRIQPNSEIVQVSSSPLSGSQLSITDQALSAAQPVLSSEQMRAFQELQAQQQAQKAIAQVTQASLQNAQTPGSP